MAKSKPLETIIGEVKMKSGIVKLPNGELYFDKMGEGKPLILIHAGFSDRRDWSYQIETLAEKCEVIAYDQRGFGNSSIIDKAYSPTDDLKAILDYFGIQKAILVGHSLGGTIAIDFALQYPGHVEALILIASGVNGYTWSSKYTEMMQSIWEIPQPDKMAERFLSANFYKLAMQNQEIKSEIEMITKENFHKVLTWKTFDMKDVHWYFPEAVTQLNNISIPTLVMYGDKDSEDIKKIAHLLHENINNSKLTVVKDADHLINFEKADELSDLILAFLFFLKYN